MVLSINAVSVLVTGGIMPVRHQQLRTVFVISYQPSFAQCMASLTFIFETRPFRLPLCYNVPKTGYNVPKCAYDSCIH
jgi:hypothetical protein